MLHAAGIDPLAMSRFFQALEEEQGDLPDLVSWISTHPQHAARIANVRAQVADLPNREYQPLEVDWASVQRRVQRTELTPSGDG
jgi:predicted Zn-dependent protease